MDKFPSRERATQAVLEPRVSAIIVARGAHPNSITQSPLDLCLRSALAEPWIDELIVVDRAASPEVSSMLRALQADRRDVKIVTAPRTLSAVAAANLGVAQARGHWLLFLDPDVVLRRGVVARLANASGGANRPAIVGGLLTDLEGRDRPVAHTGALNSWSAFALALNWPRARVRRGAGAVAPVSAVSGALMLVARRDFETLNGFDEEFVSDAADLDLCRRAIGAGGAVLFMPVSAGVQFERVDHRHRRQAQGLALFATRSARTPLQRAFAAFAGPILAMLLGFKDFVGGRRQAR